MVISPSSWMDRARPGGYGYLQVGGGELELGVLRAQQHVPGDGQAGPVGDGVVHHGEAVG